MGRQQLQPWGELGQRQRTDVTLWRTKGQQTLDRKERHTHQTWRQKTCSYGMHAVWTLWLLQRFGGSHSLCHTLYVQFMLNKTMGGTVSKWLYLGFQRAAFSSYGLIRNSFHSQNVLFIILYGGFIHLPHPQKLAYITIQNLNFNVIFVFENFNLTNHLTLYTVFWCLSSPPPPHTMLRPPPQ